MRRSNVVLFVKNEFPPLLIFPMAEIIRHRAKSPLVVAEKLPPKAYIVNLADSLQSQSGRRQPAVAVAAV